MKALIYRKFGDLSVLEWVESWPIPLVSPNSILIRSIAGGVNPKDVLLRKGKFRRTLARDPLPRVVGLEIAGEVIEVGKFVTNFAVGDIVFGMTNNFSGGIHSELATLNANEAAYTPLNISTIEASSIPLAAQTALQALRDHCKIVNGHKVLINGASGGVGHFAVQIAKALGAEVHAVCGASHLDFVTSLGADVVYDYTVDPAPTISSSFHSVFDVFGRYSRGNFTKQLGRRGIFVSTVPKPVTFLGGFLARVGFNKHSRLVQVKSNINDLDQIRKWIEANQLSSHVDKVYPVASAYEAHAHIDFYDLVKG